ncbi:MAG TPA: helix-turn-helix domain-containing protein [Solirubrobacteraceae bacterium]|nr:helix-turn-helix domain-containing protein [Solirubrobacteraceae bacterium]
MEILTPKDRVALWRAAVDAQGAQREALIHAIAKDVVESLGALDLHADEYAQLTVESLKTLDDAGLFARDSLRRGLETLHEAGGGVDLLAGEVAALLREAAGVESLGVERRIRAVEMASEWREHVLGRPRPEPAYISVGDLSARYGVSTQAVYKWLQKGRIEGTRGPGGSWRIPAAQFEQDARPSTRRERLDELARHLIAVQEDAELPSEEELGAEMRAQA